MAKSFLYAITNKKDGTIYIGWTSQEIRAYWSGHVSRANRPLKNGERKRHFYCAISKYGKDVFEWDIIQYYDTEQEAKLAEIFWIANLRSFNIPLYNETDGGDGSSGHKHTELAKQKIREAQTGSSHYSYGMPAGTHPNFGKKLPILSNKIRGKNNPFYGRTHTKDWKINNSIRNKKLTQEQADQIRQDYILIKSQRKLAKKYSVSYATINGIIAGKTYND